MKLAPIQAKFKGFDGEAEDLKQSLLEKKRNPSASSESLIEKKSNTSASGEREVRQFRTSA